MSDEIFEIACPCCGAKLSVDGKTGVVLEHQAPRRRDLPEDLTEAVKHLKQQESQRETLFDRQLDAERRHEHGLGRRFDGLLKKQQGRPQGERLLRDIDLD